MERVGQGESYGENVVYSDHSKSNLFVTIFQYDTKDATVIHFFEHEIRDLDTAPNLLSKITRKVKQIFSEEDSLEVMHVRTILFTKTSRYNFFFILRNKKRRRVEEIMC